MSTNILTDSLVKLAVIGIGIAIFVFLPWVSLDGDLKGLYWSGDDARADKNAVSLSGLNLMQADSFDGTHPPILMVVLAGLVVAAVSLVLGVILRPYSPFDPYVRFLAGAVVVIGTGYLLFVLLTGEVGTTNAFEAVLSSEEKDQTMFVVSPTDGKSYVLLAENVSPNFELAIYDYMNVHIGSLGVLVCALIIAAMGKIPSPANLKHDLMLLRLGRMTSEQQMAEAHRVWTESAPIQRRSAVHVILDNYMSYNEVSKLLDQWEAEAKAAA